MKKFVLSLCLIGLIFIGKSGAGETEKQPIQIAVYPFEPVNLESAAQATVITNAVFRELVAAGMAVRDQQSTQAAIEQIGLGQSGHCSEDMCKIEAGKILKANKLVMGSIEKLEANYYTVAIRVVDIQTGKTELSVTDDCPCQSIVQVRDLAKRLTNEQIVPYIKTGKKPEITEPQPPPPIAPVAPSTPTPVTPVVPVEPAPPRPEEIQFIAATPEQQKLCPSDMVYVPAGWFMMGCNSAKDSQCQPNENPYHAVYLDAYCIDKYEYPNQAGAEPKAKVNWSDAQGICSSQGKRLPTEAEWEKAARGTDGRVYPWGDYMDDEKKKTLQKKYNSGTYSWNVSPYGAYDMSGNLYEWVSDWYGEIYYSGSPTNNPKGPDSGSFRVLRSGSGIDGPSYMRASSHNAGYPDLQYDGAGARCARAP